MNGWMNSHEAISCPWLMSIPWPQNLSACEVVVKKCYRQVGGLRITRGLYENSGSLILASSMLGVS